MHFFGKLAQCASIVGQPAFARLNTNVFQLRVKSMVPELRRLHWPQPELFIQVALKKGLQLPVFWRLCEGLAANGDQKAGEADVDKSFHKIPNSVRLPRNSTRFVLALPAASSISNALVPPGHCFILRSGSIISFRALSCQRKRTHV